MVTLYQVCSSYQDSSKNMAIMGVVLYSYIKLFKNLFVRNRWTNFNIIWQKYSFGDPLSRFSSSRHDALKNTWQLEVGLWGKLQGYKIYTKILEQ